MIKALSLKLPKPKYTLVALAALLLIGLVLPETTKIPVTDATKNDWNHDTFWYKPWGISGVHKGIDIFGKKSTDVVAPTYGITLYTGILSLGGKVVVILGPKWRIHYLAHLDSIETAAARFVSVGEKVGTLGDTGNAVGKQPHVHYSIVSLLPYPWSFSSETQGWKRMFYVNPHKWLLDLY